MQRSPRSGFLTNSLLLTGNKVKLRPKRLVDAINDYQWRRDDELCRLDATRPTGCSFEEYLKLTAETPYNFGRSCHLAIENMDGKHIGNCSYFNVDDVAREAEIGIMIGDKSYWDQGYGADALITVLNYIFTQTNLKRVYLKTLQWNIRAQNCFKKCGFTPCGLLSREGYNFLLMEIHRPSQQPDQSSK